MALASNETPSAWSYLMAARPLRYCAATATWP
jgi:hypothetical protein